MCDFACLWIKLRALSTPIHFNMPTQFWTIHNVFECVNKGDDQIPIIPDDVSKVETIPWMSLQYCVMCAEFLFFRFDFHCSPFMPFQWNDIHSIRWALLQIASYKTFYGSWIKLTRIAIYKNSTAYKTLIWCAKGREIGILLIFMLLITDTFMRLSSSYDA